VDGTPHADGIEKFFRPIESKSPVAAQGVPSQPSDGLSRHPVGDLGERKAQTASTAVVRRANVPALKVGILGPGTIAVGQTVSRPFRPLDGAPDLRQDELAGGTTPLSHLRVLT
jgi:hypothetical protein